MKGEIEMQSRRNIYHRKFQLKPRVVIITVILLLIIASITIFQIALSPARNAQNKYESIAAKSGLTQPNNFLVSKRQKVYYSVIGKNRQNQDIAVLMQAGNKKSTSVVLKMADGISYNQVKSLIKQKYQPRKIYSIGLTIYEGAPAWDVSFLDNRNNLSFATIQFSNGKQLKLIQNL